MNVIFNLIISFAVLKLVTLKTVDIAELLIKKENYPVEIHTVETIDGYKIKLHRIPYSPSNQNPNENILPRERESVLVVHGLVNSAKTWVVKTNRNSKPPAMVLSDSGLDVWLFNARGTEPSKHKTMKVDDKSYWDFTWHEIGNIDIPTAIDYVLRMTKHEKIRYIGYSQGCAVLSVCLATRPEYNSKISSAHFIAPGVIMKGHTSLVQSVAGMRKNILAMANNLKLYSYMYNNPLADMLKSLFCSKFHMTNQLCVDALYYVVGGDSGQLKNKTELINFLAESVLDNASLKQFDHYGQLINSGVFEHYDQGKGKIYPGTIEPLPYNLSRIEVPVTIMYGAADKLAPPKGTKELAGRLKNVRNVTILPWNHLDFLYGKDANKLIYEKIAEYIHTDLNSI